MYKYQLHLQPEAEGGFTVSVPALPGCITYGDTLDEALKMAKEAVSLYIEELNARGEAVPDDTNTLSYSLIIDSE
jgi:predicted RNase H-like HicB family nuclease